MTRLCGLHAADSGSHRADVIGRRAAATANDVHPAALGEFGDHAGHRGWAEIVVAHFIGQAGVGMAADPVRRNLLQRFQVWPHQLGAEGADSCPPRARGNVRWRWRNASTSWPETNVAPPLSNVPGDHHGNALAALFEVSGDREEARLQIERVDDRFGEQDIDAGFDERGYLLVIRVGHLIERDAAKAGVVDLRADGGLLRGGTNRAGNEPRTGRACGR